MPDRKQTGPGSFILVYFVLSSLLLQAQDYRNDTLRIFFPNDRMELSPAALHDLDSILPMIIRNKKAPLILNGYADYTGTPERNQYLSDGRATALQQYLISRGIDSLRLLQCKGLGAITPAHLPETGKGIATHRKAELIIRWPVAKGKAKESKPAPKTPQQINLDNVKPGDQIVLPNLNFEGGRHVLLGISLPALSDVAKALKAHPNIKIEIQGHICCDSVNPDGYDSDTRTNELSLNRAHHIYTQLTRMGIDSSRMTYKGFGGKQRLIKNERTESDRIRNRRVEIKILSN